MTGPRGETGPRGGERVCVTRISTNRHTIWCDERGEEREMTGNMERDRERVEREGDEVVRNIEEDEDEDRISNSLLPCVFNSPVITGEREVSWCVGDPAGSF